MRPVHPSRRIRVGLCIPWSRRRQQDVAVVAVQQIQEVVQRRLQLRLQRHRRHLRVRRRQHPTAPLRTAPAVVVADLRHRIRVDMNYANSPAGRFVHGRISRLQRSPRQPHTCCCADGLPQQRVLPVQTRVALLLQLGGEVAQVPRSVR